MGEAYSAVADDATALYWNPAALIRIQKRSVALMHAAHIDSSFYDYGAFGQNLSGRGAWGLASQYFSAGKITETDETATSVGSFRPNDLALSLGYAFELNGFFLGFAGKFIRTTILNSAETGTADVGVLSPTLLGDRLRVALVASNLGGKIKLDRDSEDLPLTMTIGSSYCILDRWIAAMDVGLPRSNESFAAVGTEYVLRAGAAWNLAGRAGFNSRTIGAIAGFTGVSLGFGLSTEKFSFDYGFLPFGSLGLTQRFSVSTKF